MVVILNQWVQCLNNILEMPLCWLLKDPETGNTLLEVSRVMSDEHFEFEIISLQNPIVVQFCGRK